MKTLAKVRSTCKRDGKDFRFKPPGGHYSDPYHGTVRFLVRVARGLRRLSVGELGKVATACKGPSDIGHVYLIRRVARERRIVHRTLYFYTGNPVNLDLGNDRIAKIAQWAADNFPTLKCAGYAYNKLVLGTTTWSQHSKWPPAPGYANAIDLTIYANEANTSVDMAAMRPVALAIVAQAKLGNLAVDKVIFGNQQWQHSNGYAVTSYSGQYHYHVHVQALPYQTGTPIGA